jgi:hypothetical protein
MVDLEVDADGGDVDGDLFEPVAACVELAGLLIEGLERSDGGCHA